MDPKASRETLDHSIMYIFAVALEDGGWHHERSYAPERARGLQTVDAVAQDIDGRGSRMDAALSQPRPRRMAFGGRVVVTLKDGSVIIGRDGGG